MSENSAQGRKTIQAGKGTVLLVDSLALLQAGDAEAVVIVAQADRKAVTAASQHSLTAIFVASQPAGAERDVLSAGDEEGVPCAAISTTDAAVDVASLWTSGKVASTNAACRRRGVKEGMSVHQAAGILLAMLGVG